MGLGSNTANSETRGASLELQYRKTLRMADGDTRVADRMSLVHPMMNQILGLIIGVCNASSSRVVEVLRQLLLIWGDMLLDHPSSLEELALAGGRAVEDQRSRQNVVARNVEERRHLTVLHCEQLD